MTADSRFGTADGLGPVGDVLGRCFTDDSLAQAVVDAIEWHDGGLPFPLVVEPSVGDGAFVRAARRRWPGCTIVGVDLDPQARGLGLVDVPVVGDWSTVARFWDRHPALERIRRHARHGGPQRANIVIGNPPFGDGPGIELTIDHTLCALHIAPITAFVLPLPYLCGDEFDRVWRVQRPAVVRRIIGRPWPTRLREVAVFEWRLGSRDTRIADLAWRRAGARERS